MGNTEARNPFPESVLGSQRQILSVFFAGTANTINPPTTQIGLFANNTRALDITDPSVQVKNPF